MVLVRPCIIQRSKHLIAQGHAEVVRLMLEKGAEKHFKAPDGASYLDAAETEEIKAMLR